MGALEAVAASGQHGVLENGAALTPAAIVDMAYARATTQSSLSTERPTSREVFKREMEVPTSPQDVHRIRTGGLLKMETPTEWSVESEHKYPSPLRMDESGHASGPAAARRLSPSAARSRSPPTSQGTPSPGRSPSASPAPRALVKDAADPTPRRGGTTLAQVLAHPQSREASLQVQVEAATVAFVSTSVPAKVRPRNMGDPLPTEASTSSVGSSGVWLPAQDSITSTAASVSSKVASGKQGFSRTLASRGRALPATSDGLTPSALHPAGGAGFANGPSPGTSGRVQGSSSAFSPGLGFGDRMSRSDGFQAPRTTASPSAEGANTGISPKRAPARAVTAGAGAQREIMWGSKSTGSLPLTNMGGRSRATQSMSPTKPRRRVLAGADDKDKAAKAELAAANSEGHLPELLPAFKPGKIQKGPKTPTWLVAV